jgi:HAD superfamily hydrolase (TIGR01549 family)
MRIKKRNDRKRPFKNIDLFIFDWDGTLNSMRLTMRINEAVKRALGIWNKDSEIKDLSKMDYNLKRQLRGEEKKIDALTFLFDVLLNFSRPKLHNDTVALLKKLKRMHKKIAVMSNGRSQRLIKEFQYLGISDYFDAVVSGRHIHEIKPNPTGLKAILKEFEADPKRTVYIGDMVDDMITAKLAKVRSCAVANGFDSYHKLRSVRPDYIFRSIEELNKAI